MDFSQITPYLVAANIVLTWGLGFYVHLTSKNKVITDRLDAMEDASLKSAGQHSERIGRLEVAQSMAPTHQDLSKLYDQGNDTAKAVAGLAGEMSQMNSNIRLLLNARDR